MRRALSPCKAVRKGCDVSNEWYTPQKYVDAARLVMGGIDLDPASCEIANQVVKASRYYTKAENGFTRPWYGRVWLNPPFSKADGKGVGSWICRLVCEYQDGHVSQAILLSPSSTEVSWFQSLWSYPICFKYKRMDYYCAAVQTLSTHQSRYGTCFVYLGSHQQKFAEVFSQFGHVVPVTQSKPKPIDNTLWVESAGVA